MPKNKDDIINGTKATVVEYAPIQFGGYFKSVLVKTDTGYTFYIKQNHLCYWEDFPKIKKYY